MVRYTKQSNLDTGRKWRATFAGLFSEASTQPRAKAALESKIEALFGGTYEPVQVLEGVRYFVVGLVYRTPESGWSYSVTVVGAMRSAYVVHVQGDRFEAETRCRADIAQIIYPTSPTFGMVMFPAGFDVSRRAHQGWVAFQLAAKQYNEARGEKNPMKLDEEGRKWAVEHAHEFLHKVGS